MVLFQQYLNDIGRSEVTGWRWRRQGLIKTINLHGRLYVSREEIRRFEERAMSGEFAKKHAAAGRGTRNQ